MPSKNTKRKLRASRRDPNSAAPAMSRAHPQPFRQLLSSPFQQMGRYFGADPFPSRRWADLTYSQSDVYTASVTPGLFGTENVFRLNSLFDPDLTGVGHQPYGFDQIAGLYKLYKVYQVFIELRGVAPSNNNTTLACAIRPTQGGAVLAGNTIDYAYERPDVIKKTISSNVNPMVVIRERVSIAQVYGLTELQFNADASQYSAVVTTNPANSPYLSVSVASATSNATMSVHLTLTFRCEFWDRATQAGS